MFSTGQLLGFAVASLVLIVIPGSRWSAGPEDWR
jgi:hypothetical protein